MLAELGCAVTAEWGDWEQALCCVLYWLYDFKRSWLLASEQRSCLLVMSAPCV